MKRLVSGLVIATLLISTVMPAFAITDYSASFNNGVSYTQQYGIDVEQSMSEVRNTIDEINEMRAKGGVSEEAVKRLSSQILALAQAMAYSNDVDFDTVNGILNAAESAVMGVENNSEVLILIALTRATISTDSQGYAGSQRNGENQIVVNVMEGYTQESDSSLELTYSDFDIRNVRLGDVISMFALQNDGSLWAWGENFNGDLGLGHDEDPVLWPVKVMDGVKAFHNGAHNYVIKNDNTLWEIVPNQTKKEYVKLLDNVKEVNEGYALKYDGTVWAWGLGNIGDGKGTYGEDGNFYTREEPVKILSDVVGIYSGNYAIKNDGTVWVWGFSGTGGFRDKSGVEQDLLTPVMVPGLKDVVYICASNYHHTFFIKKDGSFWAHGDNRYGSPLGGNKPKSILCEPVLIANNVIFAEPYCYINNKYEKWCLSTYTSVKLSTPEYIKDPAIDNVIYANTTGVAIKKDGSLWLWGEHKGDGLGNGGVYDRDESTGMGTHLVVDKPFNTLNNIMIPTSNYFTATAQPTNSKVFIDGQEVSFDAYNINGNNYFKLRDVAFAINGSSKQFQVAWDGEKNAINLISNAPYTAVGGELEKGIGGSYLCMLSGSDIYKDNEKIAIKAYTINDNNYFKLRDLGEIFDFGIGWDAERNAIMIELDKNYSAN